MVLILINCRAIVAIAIGMWLWSDFLQFQQYLLIVVEYCGLLLAVCGLSHNMMVYNPGLLWAIVIVDCCGLFVGQTYNGSIIINNLINNQQQQQQQQQKPTSPKHSWANIRLVNHSQQRRLRTKSIYYLWALYFTTIAMAEHSWNSYGQHEFMDSWGLMTNNHQQSNNNWWLANQH